MPRTRRTITPRPTFTAAGEYTAQTVRNGMLDSAVRLSPSRYAGVHWEPYGRVYRAQRPSGTCRTFSRLDRARAWVRRSA